METRKRQVLSPRHSATGRLELRLLPAKVLQNLRSLVAVLGRLALQASEDPDETAEDHRDLEDGGMKIIVKAATYPGGCIAGST